MEEKRKIDFVEVEQVAADSNTVAWPIGAVKSINFEVDIASVQSEVVELEVLVASQFVYQVVLQKEAVLNLAKPELVHPLEQFDTQEHSIQP